jgi:hypothetical protein
MANENQSQQNIQETASSLKAASESYRQQANAQQDVNKAFKDSINLLNKMNKLIDDSTSKIGSFEKSTINVKRIEQERERINRRSSNLQAELSQIAKTEVDIAKDYVKKLEERKKEEDEIVKRRSLGLSVNGQILAQIETEISTIESTITAEQLRAAAIIQSNKGLEERVNIIGEELDKEEELANSLGVTGKVLQLSTKYLGVGKNLYSKIVEEAREGEFATKKMVTAGGALAAVLLTAYKGMKSLIGVAKDGFDALTGSGGPVSKFFSPFTNLIKQIPFVGGLLGGLVDAFANLADFVTGSSSAIQAFGRNLGLSVDEATKLNNRFSAISQASNNILFNSEKFRKSQTELSEALGVNNVFTDKILMSNIELADLAGLDLETRKELAAVSQITGKDQIQLYKTLLGQNSILSKNLGVNIRVQDAIKQAASLGGVLGLTFAKYPEKLTKSLLTVKSMGLELKQLDSIADSLLDFESSISKEFEAQLLTGKEINLNKAREAFLNNDLVTAAKEITQQVGTSEEFLSLNRFAAESLAASFGMSRDSMADMLKQQEFFAKLQVGDVKKYQEKVSLLSQTIEGQKELVKLLGQEEYTRVMNQTATEKVASFIDRIKQSFADLLNNSSFKDFINKALDFISKPANIEGIINKFVGFVSLMVKAIAALLDGLDMLPFVSIDKNIIDSIYKISDDIGSQKISGLMNNPESVNVGAKAATSQVNATSFGGSTAAVSKPQAGGTTVINSPNIVIEDHTKSLTARLGRSPERDMVTGIIS